MVKGATPDVVLTGVELLARGLDDARPGVGDVVVVDVGGATTDVHSVVEIDPEDGSVDAEGLAREVVAGSPVTRTVEGDLGMRWSAVSTAEAAGLDDLTAAAGVRRADPGFLPDTEAEQDEDERSPRPPSDWRSAGTPAGHASWSAPRGASSSGPAPTCAGSGWSSGPAACSGTDAPGVADRVLGASVGPDRDDLAEGWQLPERARVVVDHDYVLAAAGLLAAEHPGHGVPAASCPWWIDCPGERGRRCARPGARRPGRARGRRLPARAPVDRDASHRAAPGAAACRSAGDTSRTAAGALRRRAGGRLVVAVPRHRRRRGRARLPASRSSPWSCSRSSWPCSSRRSSCPSSTGCAATGLPRGAAAGLTVVATLGVIVALLSFAGQQVAAGAERPGRLGRRGHRRDPGLAAGRAAEPERLPGRRVPRASTGRHQRRSTRTARSSTQVTEVGTAVGHVFAGFFIVLFSMFFFLADGSRIWAWVVRLVAAGGARARSTARGGSPGSR